MSRKSTTVKPSRSRVCRIERISPRGIVERTVVPWSIPGNDRSSTYRAAPVTLAAPSLRGTLFPTERRGRVVAGQRSKVEVRGRERRPLTLRLPAIRLSRPGGFERVLQNLEGFPDFRFLDGQRRRDAEGVSVESALAEQQEAFPCLFEDAVGQGLGRRAVPGGLVLDELDRLHEPHPAHVPDVLREAPLQFLETLPQDSSHPFRVARQVVLLDDLNRRVGRCAGDGVSAERRDRQGLQRRRDLRGRDRDAEGQG